MANTNLDVVVELVDKLTGPLKKAKDQLASFEDRIGRSAVDASQKFAVGIAAGATVLGAFGMKAIDVASQAEQAQIAFSTMLGDGEKAGAFLASLADFAKKTPFDLVGLRESSKQLLAYGFDVNDILPTLKSLGDITAGVGTEKLPFLTLALGQVKTATKLTGNELRQFSEAGVPLLAELAAQSGVSVAEMQKMVSAGTVGYPMVEKALFALSAEGGRFANLMEKQSASSAGMVSNLGDAWTQFLEGEGAKLLDWHKQIVSVMISFVENTLPKVVEGLDTFIGFLRDNESVIWLMAGAIIGGLVPAFISMAVSAALAIAPLLPFIAIGALVAGAIYAIKYAIDNWDAIVAKVKEVWGFVKEYIFTKIGEIVAYVVNSWESIKAAIWEKMDAIRDSIEQAWQNVKATIETVLNFIWNFIVGIFGLMGIDILANMEIIKTILSEGWNAIKTAIVEAWTATVNWVMEKLNTLSSWMKKVWADMKVAASIAWNATKDAIFNALEALGQKIRNWVEPIREIFASLWEGVKNVALSVFDSVKAVIADTLNWIIAKINKVLGFVNMVVQAGSKITGISTPEIPQIPMLADGGIVNKPTLAMIGEAGPEAVVPLSRGRNYGVGGQNLTIIVNGDVTGEDLIERIGRELTRTVKMSTATV